MAIRRRQLDRDASSQAGTSVPDLAAESVRVTARRFRKIHGDCVKSLPQPNGEHDSTLPQSPGRWEAACAHATSPLRAASARPIGAPRKAKKFSSSPPRVTPADATFWLAGAG